MIHCERPSGKAMRPSKDEADFSHSQGVPRVILAQKPGFCARASSANRPTSTWMPAARSRSMPPPATLGLGSRSATTTRATPAETSASAHGGVRPVWLQGSSVT